jgi:hypothetical protein
VAASDNYDFLEKEMSPVDMVRFLTPIAINNFVNSALENPNTSPELFKDYLVMLFNHMDSGEFTVDDSLAEIIRSSEKIYEVYDAKAETNAESIFPGTSEMFPQGLYDKDFRNELAQGFRNFLGDQLNKDPNRVQLFIGNHIR